MPAIYETSGLRFLYPENWKVVEEEPYNWPRTVTIQSEQTSFWSLYIYPPQEDAAPLIESVIQSIREVYNELEVLPAQEIVAGLETTGVDICFFYLDLLVEAKIRCLQTPTYTLVWHYQAENKEFTEMELVFQAISTSLLQRQVARVK